MIDTFFINMSGVLIIPLHEATISSIEGIDNTKLSTPSRMAIFDLAQELSSGHIGEDEYISKVQMTIDDVDLSKDLINRIRAEMAEVPGAGQVIHELQATYRVWFISDLPKPWFLDSDLPNNIMKLVHPDQVLYQAEFDRVLGSQGMFETLFRRASKPKSECLLVNKNADVTSAAVKVGLNAILFVNAFRLRLELSLRRIL